MNHFSTMLLAADRIADRLREAEANRLAAAVRGLRPRRSIRGRLRVALGRTVVARDAARPAGVTVVRSKGAGTW